MKKLTKTLSLTLAVIIALSVPVGALAADYNSVMRQTEQIKAKYGFDVYFDKLPNYWLMAGYMVSQETNYNVLEQQLNTLDAVFANYPKTYFSTMRLISLSIVKSIYNIYDTSEGYIMGVTGSNTSGNVQMMFHSSADSLVYHHEIAHLPDMHRLYDDRTWSALNADGFRYTGVFARGDMLPPGIVSAYSMFHPAEDRADVFSYAMDNTKLKYMQELASHDIVLKKKLVLLKNFADKYIKSKAVSARLEALIQTPVAQPLYYVTSTGTGRTGPGTQYAPVKLDAAQPMPVVQAGSQYLKVLVGDTAAYFPLNTCTKVNPGTVTPPTEPDDGIIVPDDDDDEIVEPGDLAVIDDLAALGMTYTASPTANKSITGKQLTDEAKLEKILTEVYKIAKKDGFANPNVTVVRGLQVKGKAQDYAYGSKTLYIDADKFTAKKYTSFNKSLLKKYTDLRAA